MNLFPARYSIDRHTDMDRIFSIHSENGSIFTLKPLDRESSSWHNISITATEISEWGIHPPEHQSGKIIALSRLCFLREVTFSLATSECVGDLQYRNDSQISTF